MENCSKNEPVRASKGERGNIEHFEYEQSSKLKYNKMMMEIEFQCEKEAMMNNYEASGLSKKPRIVEIIEDLSDTMSASSVEEWLLSSSSEPSSLPSENFTSNRYVRMFAVEGAACLSYLLKSSSRFILFFRQQAETYVAAAAAWQHLAQKTRSYLIRLDNPELDVSDCADLYEVLIAEQKQVHGMSVIPQATREIFNDPKLVLDTIKQQRQVFQQYLQLEASDLENSKTKTRQFAQVEP
ncbi:hypothetical protein PoB_001102200 [Plakobranchus ocellatus]|uniref:RGS domain-containing protein n=1 Tax=Plakobranchus ocellatus TaxID=259542 RepID=A0AAV3YQT4_9GAST|nr:hypothetical protein PoB_001102200 [Plakobranchus ocellatus]